MNFGHFSQINRSRRIGNTKTSGLRCTKSFLDSDRKTINLKKTKKYNKFLTSDTINALNEYKQAKQKYDSTGGWFSSKSCKDYLVIRDSKDITKYKNDIDKCKTYEKTKFDKHRIYINGLSTSIKTKIIKRLTNVLKNPDEKNMLKLSCYIQLLIDLSTICGNNRLTINTIISNFNYIGEKYNNAKQYLEYLLTNKNFTDVTFKDTLYKIFKNDKTFVLTFENLIKDYAKCPI